MQTFYKVHVVDRNYTSYTYFDALDFRALELPIDPIINKLFTNDVFTINENDEKKNISIVHSTIRNSESIPGVLILKNNKTYGRSSNGKLLYKCIPDDMRIPCFLIPFEIKNMGFSKVFQNIYITFQFKEWTDKHPLGIISQNIGSVDVLDNFYEYQLYCKSLNTSIQKFTKDTAKALLKLGSQDEFTTNIRSICAKYPSIEDRTHPEWQIFSIDPEKSLDFDDAFSIRRLENNTFQMSIYISNVSICMDVFNLWDSFSRRIATIYLPDRRRPMLPTILSDCLCSLQAKHTRVAFVMDVFVNEEMKEIIDIKYSNAMISVYKNYCYEEKSLIENENYNLMFSVVKTLSLKYKYIPNVRNSHELVCYLMILMNYHTAKELLEKRNGIFRSTIMKSDMDISGELPEDVIKFIKIWNSSAGQYIDLSQIKEGETLSHDMLDMDAYIHITSPIRRLVDLLNIIQFQLNTGMIQLSDGALNFYKKWLNELEYINITMRSIRKVQNDCSLLQFCTTSPDVMNKEYTGYTFDKIVRNDGLFQFIVYLPELRLTSRIVLRENLENFHDYKFKLYLFNDEEKFKKKIRLQLL